MMRFVGWAAALAVVLCSSPAWAELRAGAAKTDITPLHWPMPMVGTFESRMAEKAFDPLHARALVLDDGKTKLAIVVIDSCYVPRAVLDEAKRRAAEATGIPPENMLMSATHTHTAPASRDRREVKADPRYVERVTQQSAKAIEIAAANLAPAELGWGVVQVPEEVFNRRWFMKEGGIDANPFGLTDDRVRMNPPRGSDLLDRPAGPTDPDVSVIAVRSVEGRPICLLANYSLHYVGGIPAGGVSADYFGEFARLVEQRMAQDSGDGPAPVGILSNGTSGDVNNIDFRQTGENEPAFSKMRKVARRVADAALEASGRAEYRRDITLQAAQRLVTLAKRRPTQQQVERARQVLAATDDASLPGRARPYARSVLELTEPPYEEELVLQALRIGEVGVAAIPCEVFAEIGLEIKAKSPLSPTFTIELANGHYGYLPTPAQHALGGYETWLGTNILEIDASEKITEAVLELLQLAAGEAPAGDTPREKETPVTQKQPEGADDLAATPLIPRKVLFGNPERASVRLCADGSKLAWLAPVDGVLNVWVAPRSDLAAARPVTKDTHRGIRQFFWAYTNEHLLYLQDKNGDEDWHVYCVDLASGEIRDLTPIDKISAQIDNLSEEFPQEIVIGVNDRDERHFHDLYRVNIVSGERKLLQLNPGFAAFITDNSYQVRLAMTFTEDAGQLWLRPDAKEEGGWKEFMKVPPEDSLTTSPLGFNKQGDTLYLLDSRERDTTALKAVDPASGDQKVLAESDKADIDGAIFHPTRHTPQAVSHTYTRTEWQVLDPQIQGDLDYLKTVADGEAQVTSRTLDDKWWTVAYSLDDGPVRYYLYDRPAKKAEFLFTSDSTLENLPLVKMHDVVIPSADGLSLVSYLSLPPGSDPDGDGRPARPLPMVLLVHGGPWARDEWGFDPEHQLLANRGYAVLAVNYRGSTGLGKAFLNAADKQWAAKMHDDLLDAVNWAVNEKIALKDKVAIMGGSYGGYATLVGLTFTPEVFACGVDIVGPSSLITLLQNPPPYWMPFMSVMNVRVGDVTTEEGQEFLKTRSPLFRVEKIVRPLLIAQGAQDPRVKQAEADQIVEAMKARNIPVTYMLFPEEGHGFAKPENRFAFYAVAEAFLAEHLGGRYQGIDDAFEGARFSIPVGAEEVPGLKAALP